VPNVSLFYSSLIDNNAVLGVQLALVSFGASFRQACPHGIDAIDAIDANRRPYL